MKTTIPIGSLRRGLLGVIATLVFSTASAADAPEDQTQKTKELPAKAFTNSLKIKTN